MGKEIVNTNHALNRYDERAAPKRGMSYDLRDRGLTRRVDEARLIGEKEPLFGKVAKNDEDDRTSEYREDPTAIFILRYGKEKIGTITVREPGDFYGPYGVIPRRTLANIAEVCGFHPVLRFTS